jgi:hypothetical protein
MSEGNDNDRQYETLLARLEALSNQVVAQQAEISQLKTELARVKDESPGKARAGQSTTSRRRMLRGLLLGSAGVIAASAALETTTQTAKAGMNFSGDAAWGGAAVPNTTGNSDTDFNNITSGHYGVIGASESSLNFSIPQVVDTGIYGASTGGYGGYFNGGKAALLFQPGSSAGAPTSGAHLRGELYAGSTGQLFYCTTGGTGGTWANLTSPLQFLSKPVRIVDTVNGTTLNGGTGTITGFGQAGTGNPSGSLIKTYNGTGTVSAVTIPANAKAITGYLYAYPGYNRLTIKPGYGYLTLWQGSTAYPFATANEGISTLRFLNGTEASTAFTVPLASPGGTFNVATSLTTHLVIEVTGYFV